MQRFFWFMDETTTLRNTVSSYLNSNDTWIDINIKVTPRSKHERIGRVVETAQGDRLEIWVNVPPVDGKANLAIERLLSQTLGVPLSQCAVRQGQTSRYKSVRLPYNENVYNKIVTLWPVHRPKQAEMFT